MQDYSDQEYNVSRNYPGPEVSERTQGVRGLFLLGEPLCQAPNVAHRAGPLANAIEPFPGDIFRSAAGPAESAENGPDRIRVAATLQCCSE